MVFRVGITGGIGAGKSSVARIASEFGHVVLDADALTREVVQFPEVKDGIIALLGAEAYGPDGLYDRRSVRQRVFADHELRSALEAIIHPAVARRFQALSEELGVISPRAWIFYEASLILEAGRAPDFDAIVLVSAPEDDRLERVQRRSGLTREQAHAVMSAQWTDDLRRPLCHFEIRNDSAPEALVPRVHALLASLRERFSARTS